MSILHQARARRKAGQEGSEAGQDGETSPVKTVLGSLVVNNISNTVTNKTHNVDREDFDNKKPVKIEDVPFRISSQAVIPTKIEDIPWRRQDRRILNARYRRLMDKKLIIFIVSVGLILISLGFFLMGLYKFHHEESKHFRPFIVIGPVLIGGGFITLLCSVEVCVRLYKAKKRVQDPELDNLINPHEVKHWMDPKIIPFGWGLFSEDGDEILVLDKASTNYILDAVKPGRRGSKGMASAAAKLDSMIDMEKEEDAVSVKAEASLQKPDGIGVIV